MGLPFAEVMVRISVVSHNGTGVVTSVSETVGGIFRLPQQVKSVGQFLFLFQ